MNEPERLAVLEALREKLKLQKDGSDDDLHPVVLLWRNADIEACQALATCYAQYTNLHDHILAEKIPTEGIKRVGESIEQMIKDETGDSSELLTLIAKGLENITSDEKCLNSKKHLLVTAFRYAQVEAQRDSEVFEGAIRKARKAQEKEAELRLSLVAASDATLAASIQLKLDDQETKRKSYEDAGDRALKVKQTKELELKVAKDLLAAAVETQHGAIEARVESVDAVAEREPQKHEDGNLNSRSPVKGRIKNIANTLLSREENKAGLVQFLTATDELAIRLRNENSSETDMNFFIGGFIRSQLGDDFRRRKSLLSVSEGLLQYVLGRVDTLSLAQSAYAHERKLLNKEQAAYPAEYAKPFGLPGSVFRFAYEHSYFSARVACAALFYLRASNQELPYCRVLTSMFWVKNYARDELVNFAFLPPPFAPTEFCAAVLRYYVDADDEPRKPLASEYDSADQWHRSLGMLGTSTGSAKSLLVGTRGDAAFALKVFTALMNSEYSTSAQIAVAGKFGAYFRANPEPNCTTANGSRLSATEQINVIRSLHRKVKNFEEGKGTFQVGCGIVHATHLIYFKRWPSTSTSDLVDGCVWEDPEELQGDWNERSSDDHVRKILRMKAGAHLWLYGTHFQALVDSTIGRIKAELIDSSADISGDEERFARFVFLVPFTLKSEKELRDWPGESAMQHVLQYIGCAGVVADFDLTTELYEPIVIKKKPVPDCLMFVPMFDQNRAVV